MTPRELAAIRARWAAAPPGPWCDDVDGEDGVLRVWFRPTPGLDPAGRPHDYALSAACVVFPGDMESYEGADLAAARALAHAPADIAALLAAVDGLLALRDRLRDRLRAAADGGEG